MSETDSLQAALAGEHAALYAVGVAGGHLRGAQYSSARALHTEHELRRDRLTEMLLTSGEEPVPAEPTYDLPGLVSDAAAASALIRLVEQRLAVVYGDLVAAATAGTTRTFAVQALIAAARAQVAWGGKPLAFPGG